MTLEEYTEAVLAKLPAIPEAFDLEATKRQIVECYGDGFPIIGAVSYCKCLEHVNPELSEDLALRRMKELGAKYRKPGSPGDIRRKMFDNITSK